jgi:hypothetical protein
MKFDAVQNLLFERVPEVWEPFEENSDRTRSGEFGRVSAF